MRDIINLIEENMISKDTVVFEVIKIYIETISSDIRAKRQFPILDDDSLSDAIGAYTASNGGYSIEKYREIRDMVSDKFIVHG